MAKGGALALALSDAHAGEGVNRTKQRQDRRVLGAEVRKRRHRREGGAMREGFVLRHRPEEEDECRRRWGSIELCVGVFVVLGLVYALSTTLSNLNRDEISFERGGG